MEQNSINYNNQMHPVQQKNPNAVEINIVAPQAFANPAVSNTSGTNGFYSLYQPNQVGGNYIYPQNYNNMITHPTNNQYVTNPQIQQVPQDVNREYDNRMQYDSSNKLQEKTPSETKEVDNNQKVLTKKVTPLTDDYIKSVENYMNSENPKIRLIGAKEVLDRFKEDENRKDNPSLMPLLNKALKDSSPSVRFLALTALKLGYSVGNDETVQLLKQIQTSNSDMSGEESIMASEILLGMAGGEKVESPMTPNEIEKANKKENNQDKNVDNTQAE